MLSPLPASMLCCLPAAELAACTVSISGIFFVLPCIESYQRVDLRTITLDVPPQEVTQRKQSDNDAVVTKTETTNQYITDYMLHATFNQYFSGLLPA